jgi:hypothetical protein
MNSSASLPLLPTCSIFAPGVVPSASHRDSHSARTYPLLVSRISESHTSLKTVPCRAWHAAKSSSRIVTLLLCPAEPMKPLVCARDRCVRACCSQPWTAK